MKKGKSGKSRKNYRQRRTVKKVASAVLLVLLILAFIGIKWRESGGTLYAAGPEQTQESASLDRTSKGEAEETAASQAGVSPDNQPEDPAEQPGDLQGDPAEQPGDLQGDPAEQPGDPEEVPAERPDERPGANPADTFTLDSVPPYSGQPYADINGDVPFFTDEEMTSEAFHQYWPLDELGRCTGAYACVGPETLPKQKRGDISEVRPTGWNTNRYDDIDGEMIFNRCHMIGHMLTGQDANERNLITGTRYMNVEGMLPFEESVHMYVEGTGNHVMYRVRPYFDGDNLVCAGVLMEARSVEDPLVQFCAFCYNVQPGFEIDYATGDNWRANETGVQRITADPGTEEEPGTRQSGAGGTAAEEEEAESVSRASGTDPAGAAPDAEEAGTDPAESADQGVEITYIINTNTRRFHMPYCDSVKDMKDKNKKETTLDRDTLIGQGYKPCQRCHP